MSIIKKWNGDPKEHISTIMLACEDINEYLNMTAKLFVKSYRGDEHKWFEHLKAISIDSFEALMQSD